MTTEAQIEANRRNAQLSTGPRTPEGKARSSQNALKHGIRAQAILDAQFTLLGEDPQQFASLLDALADDLQPVGAIEATCVEAVALSLWRHRRLLLAEMGYIHQQQHSLRPSQDPAQEARLSLPSFLYLEKLMRYETNLTRQLQWSLSRLAQLQALRQTQAKAAAPKQSQSPDRSFHDALLAYLATTSPRFFSPTSPSSPLQASVQAPTDPTTIPAHHPGDSRNPVLPDPVIPAQAGIQTPFAQAPAPQSPAAPCAPSQEAPSLPNKPNSLPAPSLSSGPLPPAPDPHPPTPTQAETQAPFRAWVSRKARPPAL